LIPGLSYQNFLVLKVTILESEKGKNINGNLEISHQWNGN